jgi:UDP-3-O-[3-hydroxymyristoyl] glucosamine N-acyltransferase
MVMTVSEIARLLNGLVRGRADRQISGVAALQTAGPSDLTFATDTRALAQATDSYAGCILIPEGNSLEGHTTVAVREPKLAFIRAAAELVPATRHTGGVHPTAVVMPEAALGAGVSLGPHCVIGSRARVGARTRLAAGVVVSEDAEIGEDCVIHPGVTIYAGAQIRDRVILHAGVVIGGDGFGYVFADGRHQKFPQIGGVVIEEDVEIGSNSTVDRGSLGTTVIGKGTKIDNLVQIAHNVRIGKHCVIVAQAGISGSVSVGDYAVIGGQVGIGDHVKIEEGATIASGGGVLPGKIVRKGSVIWGVPGRPLAVFKRQYAHLSRLPELVRRVSRLERLLRSESPTPPSEPKT